MNLKTSKLLPAALGVGALGFCLRLLLYRFGFDEKNIISSTHPLHLMCLALAAVTAVYLALTVRKLGGSNDPSVNFPETPLGRLGCFAAACLTAFHGVTLAGDLQGPLAVARMTAALGSGVCMLLCALVPTDRRRVRILCRGVICACFALDMLCRYQSWSGNPQLPDYVFQVLSCVLLCLCSYQRLAFDTGLGNRRRLLFSGLMGLCLCLFCAAGPETRGFYLGGAFWAGACLCRFTPPPEATREEETPDVPA